MFLVFPHSTDAPPVLIQRHIRAGISLTLPLVGANNRFAAMTRFRGMTLACHLFEPWGQ